MSIFIFLLLLGYGWARVLPNGCPEDDTVHMLLPHETDCSKFYQCNHGARVLRECGPGTVFDEKLQVCNWPSAVNCDQSNTSTTAAPIASTTPSESSTAGSSSTTAASSSTTAAPSSTTSVSSSTTLTPSSTTSAPASTSSAPSSTTAAPSSTTSASSSTTGSSSSTTGSSSSTTGSSSSTTASSSSTTASPSSTEHPPEPDECPSDYKVKLKLPDDIDCSKYISCSDGVKLLLKCPTRKVFDMTFQVNYTKNFDFDK